MRLLGESYPMHTNMTGLRCALDESSLSIERVKKVGLDRVMGIAYFGVCFRLEWKRAGFRYFEKKLFEDRFNVEQRYFNLGKTGLTKGLTLNMLE